MGLALAILIVAALLGGFLFLTRVERRSGRRMFASSRARLDAKAEHALHVVKEADLGRLSFHALQAAFDHLMHEVVHAVLFAVRLLERLLTRTAKYLRGRREDSSLDPRKPLTESVERIKEALKGPVE